MNTKFQFPLKIDYKTDSYLKVLDNLNIKIDETEDDVTQQDLHGQAKPCVALEPAVGCDHVDGGRLEGELCRKDQLSVINATVVRRLFRAGDTVVPLKEVVGDRLGHDVRNRILLQSHQVHSKPGNGSHRTAGFATGSRHFFGGSKKKSF